MSRRGSNAVEFALLLPILLILLAGVVDVGQYLYVAESVVAAAAEGARAGSLADPDDGDYPIAVANQIATTVWDASDLPGTFNVTSVTSGVAPNQILVVTTTSTYTAAFGFVSLPTSASYTHTLRLYHQ